MGIGKTSVFRAVQAAAEQVPGLKREKLLGGYQTKAVGADVTSVRCNGQWVTVGIDLPPENWSNYRVFDWQPEVPWTNYTTEQVIGCL